MIYARKPGTGLHPLPFAARGWRCPLGVANYIVRAGSLVVVGGVWMMIDAYTKKKSVSVSRARRERYGRRSEAWEGHRGRNSGGRLRCADLIDLSGMRGR